MKNDQIIWAPEHCAESARLCAVMAAATTMLDAAEEARALVKDAAARREEQRARRRYDEASEALGAFSARMEAEYRVTASSPQI